MALDTGEARRANMPSLMACFKRGGKNDVVPASTDTEGTESGADGETRVPAAKDSELIELATLEPGLRDKLAMFDFNESGFIETTDLIFAAETTKSLRKANVTLKRWLIFCALIILVELLGNFGLTWVRSLRNI